MAEKQIQTVPFLTSLFRLFKFVDNPIPIVCDALDTYGNTYYTRIIGGRKIIMTSDPDVAQHVLQKNHRNYYKSHLQTDALGRYVGQGLLTTNGEYWLRQRRLIQPGFHRTRLAALVEIMDEEIRLYADDLNNRISGDRSFQADMMGEMMELTLRVVSRALFSTGISKKQILELGSAITELQEHIVKEVRQPVFNWWRLISGKRRRAYKLAEATRDILYRIIEDRKTNKQVFDDLLQMLIESRYEDTGESMTERQLLDEALILFVAGHETTAVCLAWTFYYLHQNPAVRSKLLEEIQNADALDMDSLAGLQYTDMVIRESLRIVPPVWIIDRVALEDDGINHVKIEKGDMVGIFIYGIHNDHNIWGDPDIFRPERFINEKKEGLHAYAYLPFGGGPRLCIGQHFSILEMKLVLVRLLSRFSFQLCEDQKVEMQPLITIRPRYGMKMNILRREH